MRLLHCNIAVKQLCYVRIGRKAWGPAMDFFTELFSRSRHRADPRVSAALAILNAMSHRERREIRILPPDFPRRPRELALR